MTAMRVGVIDYGVGNLRSVANALIEIGADPCISADPAELAACPRLILPGVGAFGEGMRALQATRLDRLVHDAAAGGTPLLGICLGMQMLVESSTEFGQWDGLSILPGQVAKLDDPLAENKQRLPNVGWLPVHRIASRIKRCSRLSAMPVSPPSPLRLRPEGCSTASTRLRASTSSIPSPSPATAPPRSRQPFTAGTTLQRSLPGAM